MHEEHLHRAYLHLTDRLAKEKMNAIMQAVASRVDKGLLASGQSRKLMKPGSSCAT